jgi:hypothetical protein
MKCCIAQRQEATISGTDYTVTPNLGLFKPIPEKDVGQWGTHWNVNADTLDTWLTTGTGGKFLPLTGGTLTGPLYYTATGGSVARSAQNRAADYVNVKDFGAVGDQATDDTAAIRAALATNKNVYMPAGTYRLTDSITVGNATRAQTLFGDGKASRFYIDTRFSGSATNVIALLGSEDQAPCIRDLELVFIQPATFTRAGMMTISAYIAAGSPANTGIQYPVAIDQATSNRFRLDTIRISGGAWIGIQCTNSGWWIRDIEESCLNIGLNVQNTAGGDFCHCAGWHHWNYGIAYTGTPFSDGVPYSIVVGNGNQIHFDSLNLFAGKLKVDSGSAGVGVFFNNLSLDTTCCEITSGAAISFSNVYSTGNNSNAPAFNLSGGMVSLTNVYGWPANGQPYLLNTGANITMVGGRPQSTTNDVPVLDIRGGFNIISDVAIAPLGGATYTTKHPVEVSGGVLVMTGCRIAGTATSSIGAVGITTDGAGNVIVGNDWNTWPFTAPGPLGCYGPNTGSGAATGTRFSSNVTFDGNIGFGPAFASTTTDYTHYINLFGANYGINVTSNRVNYNSNGAHVFMFAGADVASFSATGSYFHGTTTNDSAAAGNVGEYVSSTVVSGSALALTSGANLNVTSVSLTAGDWDISGSVGYTGTSNQCTIQQGGASLTSVTLPTVAGGVVSISGASNLGDKLVALPQTRVSLASTQTLYLVALAGFGSGACSAYGSVQARRVR